MNNNKRIIHTSVAVLFGSKLCQYFMVITTAEVALQCHLKQYEMIT